MNDKQLKQAIKRLSNFELTAVAVFAMLKLIKLGLATPEDDIARWFLIGELAQAGIDPPVALFPVGGIS